MTNSALHWLQSRRAEMLIRLISFDFSLSFYSIFPRPDPPLNPCGYFTCLMNDETSVILTQLLHHHMPVLRNVSRNLHRDLSAGCLRANNSTKTCKKCNESKTPHICWLQSYLECEWGFPRVQLLFQTDIKTSQKELQPAKTPLNTITKFITFVFADLLERIKWLLAMDLKEIKMFSLYMSALM
jgi:hypothetical protein